MPLRAPPLRLLVTLLVVLPILAVASALVWLSASTSRRVAEDLGRSVLVSASDRAAGEVTRYLRGAVRVSDLYARRMRSGRLPVSDLDAWKPAMLEDLVTSPDVASICVGTPEGAATWLLRGQGGRLELGVVRAGLNDEAREFVVSASDGSVAPEPLRVYRYDPRERPWYTAAGGSMTPLWTPVYFWFGGAGVDATTGAGYTRAVRTGGGELLGVLVVDVTLGALSDFLRRMDIASDGHVFIVDADGLLVAASEGSVTTPDGRRAALSGTPGVAADAARRALERSGRSPVVFERVATPEGPARVMVAPLAPGPGINWTIVTVLPESGFMGEARAEQRRGVLLAGLSTLAGLALGWRVSRGMAAPLVKVSEHVKRIGSGDFKARLHLRSAQELERLSADLNRMSEDLASRAELEQAMAVAAEVQRSLLPGRDPTPPGLDIAGRSRYCDAAGGDYFDYITLPGPAGPRTLLAVGDVMGHGIGAALLMASARAAIRARVAVDADLASILTAVNRVLAEDARHNQFMTMALVAVDPASGEAAWASAGHDPAIVYHPADDRFEELDGGDVPLGTLEETVYQQYTRRCLGPGDVMIIGTDGIWEMAAPGGRRFGKDRLREVLRAHHGGPASEVAGAIDRALAEFRSTEPQRDDVTYVVVRLSGPGSNLGRGVG